MNWERPMFVEFCSSIPTCVIISSVFSWWGIENFYVIFPYSLKERVKQGYFSGCLKRFFFFFAVALQPNTGHGVLIVEVFLDHTRWRTTVGWTPLDEWSARHRDLYLTTRNTHNRQTSMPPMGFETTISAGERPQTYALDRAATGTGHNMLLPK